jgi:hypothetical protein
MAVSCCACQSMIEAIGRDAHATRRHCAGCAHPRQCNCPDEDRDGRVASRVPLLFVVPYKAGP